MKKYSCSWFCPTYYSGFSIETEETINDTHRGFIESGQAEIINNMSVGEVHKFEGLIVVRLDDNIEN